MPGGPALELQSEQGQEIFFGLDWFLTKLLS
jgi:hypothetical protein